MIYMQSSATINAVAAVRQRSPESLVRRSTRCLSWVFPEQKQRTVKQKYQVTQPDCHLRTCSIATNSHKQQPSGSDCQPALHTSNPPSGDSQRSGIPPHVTCQPIPPSGVHRDAFRQILRLIYMLSALLTLSIWLPMLYRVDDVLNVICRKQSRRQRPSNRP